MATAMTSQGFGATLPVTIKFNDSFQTLAYHVRGDVQNTYAEAFFHKYTRTLQCGILDSTVLDYITNI